MLNLRDGKVSINNYVVLDHANLDIEPSLLTIVIGPNGAGKTSLLNVLAGAKKLTEGSLTSSYKRNILIPQRAYYPEGITLFEYMSSVFYQKGWKWGLSKEEKNQIDVILEKLSLLDKKNLYISDLSAGELQLANIALCVLSGADFILLDEPSANLDLLNQIMILDFLKSLAASGITIVAVMHDISLAARYGDKFVIISRNGKLLFGDRSEIITKQVLSQSYNVDFNVIEANENLFVQPNI